jgi:DNA-binding response OmpR family regulator
MDMLPKILIVDDDEYVREVIESLLSSQQIELLFAENGAAGIKLAEQFLPDAILLDVMMPGLDGYETCRRIRATPKLAEVPIILITALDDRDARLAGLMAGADDFLTKPFDGLEIQIRVKNILRLNRYRNLAAERSRFYWVVENDEKGYLVLDEDGKIQYANQGAQTYLHLPEAYAQIDFAQQVGRYYQRHTFDEGQNYHIGDRTSYLVQPESATARAFWLRVEVLRSPSGTETQRLVRLSNVTDEMSTQQDIRKIHLLVAHKLRTPVGLIYTSMSLLDKQMGVSSGEDIRPLVQTAWKGTERLVKEVIDILKYIDAPIALNHGLPVSLNEIRRLILTVSETLGLKDVTLIPSGPLSDCELGISTTAMELVIFEILENSQKFHPQQTPQVQVRFEMHGEHSLQLQFLDDGQVMTAEQINRAKLPYSQSEKWFTGEVAGMGLGIPLVATLIWQTGGQVRIANRSDRAGLCVSLVLPVIRPDGSSNRA